MNTNNFVDLLISFLITVAAYVTPIILIRLKGPQNKKSAHRIALVISILVALVFIMIRVNNNINRSSGAPAFFYYFINKWILHYGYGAEESESDSARGASILEIKNDESNNLKNLISDNTDLGEYSKVTNKSNDTDSTNNTNIQPQIKETSVHAFRNLDYRKTYQSLNPEVGSMIFSGGYEDFRIVLDSLKYLFGKKYTSVELTKIYAKNWVRTEQSETDEVVRRIKLSNEMKDYEDKIDLLVAFILIHKKNFDFEIKDNETFTITKMLAESFSKSAKNKEINDNKTMQNIHDEDYGKVANKPIYVNGFRGSEDFLKRLRSENGEGFRHDRKGSIPTDNGSVDIYEIENVNTLDKDIIYLNLYSNNSNYITPKGYNLASLEDEEVGNGGSEQTNKKDTPDTQTKSENQKPHIELQHEEVTKVKEKTCTKCNHKNPEESKYCSNCGSELLTKKFCKQCGSSIQEDSNFCHMCGNGVKV